MPKLIKNEFDSKTKDILAKRANLKCSNLDCGIPTSGPHTEKHRSINIGEAAHIKGANPGSARYEANMSPIERSSIINGIWLCRKCARLIDTDPYKYSVEVLYEWKSVHESNVDLELNGNNWQRKIRERGLEDFKNESVLARQIVFDKPKHWELLLISELFKTKLNTVTQDYIDLHRGLKFKFSRNIKNNEVLVWFGLKIDDFTGILKIITESINYDLIDSIGVIGHLGDQNKILKTVNTIIKALNFFIEWERDLLYSKFSEEVKPVQEIMVGWTKPFIDETYKIPNELERILSLKPTSGEFSINLLFTAPENVESVMPTLTKLVSEEVIS
jgi:hypothetical protein